MRKTRRPDITSSLGHRAAPAAADVTVEQRGNTKTLRHSLVSVAAVFKCWSCGKVRRRWDDEIMVECVQCCKHNKRPILVKLVCWRHQYQTLVTVLRCVGFTTSCRQGQSLKWRSGTSHLVKQTNVLSCFFTHRETRVWKRLSCSIISMPLCRRFFFCTLLKITYKVSFRQIGDLLWLFNQRFMKLQNIPPWRNVMSWSQTPRQQISDSKAKNVAGSDVIHSVQLRLYWWLLGAYFV